MEKKILSKKIIIHNIKILKWKYVLKASEFRCPKANAFYSITSMLYYINNYVFIYLIVMTVHIYHHFNSHFFCYNFNG